MYYTRNTTIFAFLMLKNVTTHILYDISQMNAL